MDVSVRVEDDALAKAAIGMTPPAIRTFPKRPSHVFRQEDTHEHQAGRSALTNVTRKLGRTAPGINGLATRTTTARPSLATMLSAKYYEAAGAFHVHGSPASCRPTIRSTVQSPHVEIATSNPTLLPCTPMPHFRNDRQERCASRIRISPHDGVINGQP